MVEEQIDYVDASPQAMNYPAMFAQKSDKADLLDKIKPDLIVEVIRHKLMGEELIGDKWIKDPELQSRALTKRGATDIANLMLAVSSQNVSISKLEDEEIKKRAKSIAKTAQRMCLKNWKEYGITGTDQLFFVNELVFSNSFITLKQPEGGGIRNLIKGTTTEVRSVNENQDKGFFSSWGKKS